MAPALLNFLALLGWSYDDKTTVMSQAELVDRFSLERVGTSPATFDYAKLDWLNGVYLRGMPPDEYARRPRRLPARAGLRLGRGAGPALGRRSSRRRSPGSASIPAFAGFLFAPVEPDASALGESAAVLAEAQRRLAAVEPFTAERIEEALRALCDELGLKPRDAFQPIRIAVTGSKISPGLFESVELLGREATLERLEAAATASAKTAH